MEENIMMISGSAFKQMLADAAYEGAKKALSEVGTNRPVQKEYLSLTEAATYISDKGISITSGTLKNKIARGEVRYCKINRKLAFLPEDLDFWIEKNANWSTASLENAERELIKSARRRRIKNA